MKTHDPLLGVFPGRAGRSLDCCRTTGLPAGGLWIGCPALKILIVVPGSDSGTLPFLGCCKSDADLEIRRHKLPISRQDCVSVYAFNIDLYEATTVSTHRKVPIFRQAGASCCLLLRLTFADPRSGKRPMGRGVVVCLGFGESTLFSFDFAGVGEHRSTRSFNLEVPLKSDSPIFRDPRESAPEAPL